MPGFVNYKIECTRLAAASDKVYHLLAPGWWLSTGTAASFTTKTGCHDISEILLKVTLNTINQIKSDCPFGIFKRFTLQTVLTHTEYDQRSKLMITANQSKVR